MFYNMEEVAHSQVWETKYQNKEYFEYSYKREYNDLFKNTTSIVKLQDKK